MSFSAIVSADWLLEHLRDPRVHVLDASWYLSAMKRDPRRDFREGHIPGAQLFSIDDASDASSPLPHTLPSAAQFGDVVSCLGISSSDHVIVYDASGANFSAPRAWWMFRAFGHDAVSVLDGGFAAWSAVGGPIETGDPAAVPRGAFHAAFRPGMLRTAAEVRLTQQEGTAQVVDMRSRGRFEGSEPEPRPGLRSGHIPGSRSLPFASFVDARGMIRSAAELRELMEKAGIDVARPVIASCGSGVTACSLLLALDMIGVPGAALYDGSWSEWGRRTDLPIETGPPR
jgi:thiosulfate/3-mercaptopyruvate sulfurtransferase